MSRHIITTTYSKPFISWRVKGRHFSGRGCFLRAMSYAKRCGFIKIG